MNRRAGLLLLFLFLGSCSRGQPYTYSGTVQAPSAAVGSTVAGRVVEVMVTDGQAIRKGRPLLRFDDAQARAALTSANARLGQAGATLSDLLVGPREADLARARALADEQRAQLRLARATVPYQVSAGLSQVQQARARVDETGASAGAAHTDANRMRSLFATGDVSAQTRDAAVAQEQRTRAQLANANAAVQDALAQANNTSAVVLPQNAAAAAAGYEAAQGQYDSLAQGARPEKIREAAASVRAARAEADAARARLRETIVRAPADGVITALDLHPGDLVVPGTSIATIEEGGNPYVRVYVPQSELGRVRVGAVVDVRSDAMPDRLQGVVEQVDARAQFTPQNVQTSNDRAVLSFGVKVRIRDPQHKLHPGTTLEVIPS